MKADADRAGAPPQSVPQQPFPTTNPLEGDDLLLAMLRTHYMTLAFAFCGVFSNSSPSHF
jgi:hypothetical protein